MDPTVFTLTGFQRDLLCVIYGLDDPSGQEIKAELEEVLDGVTHGQLYPNLDTLVDQDLVRKGQIDRRTNYYETTAAGETALRRRREWEDRFLDF
jgi:DNA-binding PadR family transcriptional regulator